MKILQDLAKFLDPEVPHDYLEKYYQEHYLKLLTIIGASTLAFVILIFCTIFCWYKGTHLPERRMFMVYPGVVTKQIPLYLKPLSNPTAIRTWTAKALRDIYTIDFLNYSTQIANSRKYFTADAADLFESKLKDGLLKNVKKNKLQVSAMVVDKPIIVQSGNLGNISAWKIETIVSVLYEGSAAEVVNHKYKVYLTIVSMPTTDNYRGIGITQLKVDTNVNSKEEKGNG